MQKPTGVVERTAVILRAVAAEGSQGARLRDLAVATGISRPSVHRILQELSDVGFVQQLEDKSYCLGPELYFLGMSAPSPHIDLGRINTLLQELAQECGDTVYLARRQFDGVNYLIRAEGSYPVKALLVEVGQTKPFSSSYAGLALLAGMPEMEQERVLTHRVFDIPEGWLGDVDVETLLRTKLREVHSVGYCSGQSIVYPGISGMSAPVPNGDLAPVFAVSISATDDRLTPERIALLAPLLQATVKKISHMLSNSHTKDIS